MSSKGRVRGNVLWERLTSFFNDWSSEMIFPLLPTFLAEVLGIPRTVIGLIDGLAQSLSSLLKVFSGYISDRVGQRKRFAVAGYVLSNAVKPLLAFAQGWPLALFVRAADRVGKGIRTAPRDAMIAASSPKPAGRGRSFGFHRAMDTSGAVLGTLTAFALMALIPGEPYRMVFVLAVVPGAVGVLCILLGVREREGAVSGRQIKLSWGLLSPQLRRLILASVVFGVGNFTFTFFLLRVRGMGVSVALIPLVYLVHNVIYAAGSYPAGVLSDRLGKKRVLLSGYAVYVLVALGFAFFDAPVAAWLLMAVFGVHMALTDATARALVSDLAPEETRGTALGVYHTGVGLADLPAGLLAGILWDVVSPQAVFLAGAVLAVAALILLATVRAESDPAG